MEVCPHPKLVTHQFICFGSAELTIHMFRNDKIAELIIAVSKKNKPPQLMATSPQSPRVFPRSVGSNLFAWATLVLSNLKQKLGNVSTLDKSALCPQ